MDNLPKVWSHPLCSVLHRAGKLRESVAGELLQYFYNSVSKYTGAKLQLTSAGLNSGLKPPTAPDH